MEIKSITLENFQSHVKTVIEPAPAGKLTVIVGPSDSGKTAIIRALRWLFCNVPQGTDFINVRAGAARVAVDYADGRRVVRERHSRNYNRYAVDEQKFEGFGSGVPLEVQEATGVRPVTIGDLEFNLNLAEQLDGPFLGKSVSAGARAKVLGKLAGTEEIDYAQKQLNTDLYRRRQEEKSLAAEIAELEEQIRQFDYLPALAERIAQLERLAAQIKAALERRERLICAGMKVRQVDEQTQETELVIWRWRGIETAAQTADRAEGIIAKKEAVCRKKRELFAAEEAISRNAETVRRWRGLARAEESHAAAAAAAGRRQAFVKLKNGLERIQNAIALTEYAVNALAGIEQAGETVSAAGEKAKRRELLLNIDEKLQRVNSCIELFAGVCRRWAGTGEAETLLQKAEAAAAQKEKIAALAGRLGRMNALIQKEKGNVVFWENRTGELEGAYRDQLAAVGVCPLCGSKIQKPLKEAI
jgi:energy-coupling factor transporter ATP-binding protein EcfA2